MSILTTEREAPIETRYGAAELGRSVGVNLPDMPCAIVTKGEMTPSGLVEWIGAHEDILLIPEYELIMYQDENGLPMFRENRRGREVQIPENALFLRTWTRSFFPEEILPSEKDARFGDFGELTAYQWNPSAWWYEHGRDGSTALLLEAVLQAWETSPSELVRHFDRMSISSTDGPIRLTIRGLADSIAVEGYRLRRPATKSAGN